MHPVRVVLAERTAEKAAEEHGEELDVDEDEAQRDHRRSGRIELVVDDGVAVRL